MSKNLIIFIFISTIFAQADVKITEAVISFTGSHPFHDWTGISTDLKLDLNCSDKDETCHYLFSVPWTSFDSGNDNRDNNMLYYVNAYEFHQEPFRLDEQISFIQSEIKVNERVFFRTLIPHLKTRLCIVVTFMAILEMLRTNQILVEQNQPFGELILIRRFAS